MTHINNSVLSKVKDGLIVSLAVAVLFVAGFAGNFTKPTALDNFPTYHAEQYEGGARLLPVGPNNGGPDGG